MEAADAAKAAANEEEGDKSQGHEKGAEMPRHAAGRYEEASLLYYQPSPSVHSQKTPTRTTGELVTAQGLVYTYGLVEPGLGKRRDDLEEAHDLFRFEGEPCAVRSEIPRYVGQPCLPNRPPW